MNIGGKDDFEIFQIGRQVGYIQRMLLDGEGGSLKKGVCRQQEGRQTSQELFEREMPPLGPAVFIVILGHRAASPQKALPI